MENYYIQSLQMINNLNIKNTKEYNKLLNYFLLLNVESLKYISQTRNFREIIKLAKNIQE